MFKRMLYFIIIFLGLMPSIKSTATEKPLSPVTVCEVLAELKSYNGKSIAVLGRWTATMEGRWLGESDCEQKLKTNELKWDDSLSLEYDPSSPSAFNDGLVVDKDALKKKLAAISKRTRLRSKGDAWAIVYGKVETHEEIIIGQIPPGRKARWYGFGHLNGSPAQLVFKDKDARIISENEARELLKE